MSRTGYFAYAHFPFWNYCVCLSGKCLLQLLPLSSLWEAWWNGEMVVDQWCFPPRLGRYSVYCWYASHCTGKPRRLSYHRLQSLSRSIYRGPLTNAKSGFHSWSFFTHSSCGDMKDCYHCYCLLLFCSFLHGAQKSPIAYFPLPWLDFRSQVWFSACTA